MRTQESTKKDGFIFSCLHVAALEAKPPQKGDILSLPLFSKSNLTPLLAQISQGVQLGDFEAFQHIENPLHCKKQAQSGKVAEAHSPETYYMKPYCVPLCLCDFVT